MSDQEKTPPDLDRLLNELVDGLLSEEEEANFNALLASNPAVRDQYLRFMALHASLHRDYGALAAASTDGNRSALAEQSGSNQPAPVAGQTSGQLVHWKSWPWAAAMVAGLALCFIVILRWMPAGGQSQPDLVTVLEVSGDVAWEGAGAAQRAVGPSTKRLPPGTLRLADETSLIDVQFADQTRISMRGPAELAYEDVGQKRLTLRRGVLTADVKPQPAEKPLVIRTATAETVVLGTKFVLSAQQEQTTLAVEKGQVRLRRLADGEELNVHQQQLAVVDRADQTALTTRIVPVLPESWKRTFEIPPPENWLADWLEPDDSEPGRMSAVPRPTRKGGIHYRIHAMAKLGPLVAVTPQSVIRIRFRTRERSRMTVFTSLHSEKSRFVGNYERFFASEEGLDDSSGWRTFVVPFSTLQSASSSFPPLPERGQLGFIYLSSLEHDVGLEIAEIEITPN